MVNKCPPGQSGGMFIDIVGGGDDDGELSCVVFAFQKLRPCGVFAVVVGRRVAGGVVCLQ